MFCQLLWCQLRFTSKFSRVLLAIVMSITIYIQVFPYFVSYCDVNYELHSSFPVFCQLLWCQLRFTFKFSRVLSAIVMSITIYIQVFPCFVSYCDVNYDLHSSFPMLLIRWCTNRIDIAKYMFTLILFLMQNKILLISVMWWRIFILYEYNMQIRKHCRAICNYTEHKYADYCSWK